MKKNRISKKKQKFIEELKRACLENGLRCYSYTKYPDKKLTAVKLRTDRGMSPVQYLEDYYNPRKKEQNVKMIAEDIRSILESNRVEYPEILLDMMQEYEIVKKYLKGRIVEKKNFFEDDSEIQYVSFWNLSISFYLDFEDVCVTVRKRFLDMWNVTETGLMEQVIENEKDNIKIEPFEDYLTKEFKMRFGAEFLEYPRYLLGISGNCFGAVCMAYGKYAFSALAEKYGDLLIVPLTFKHIMCIPMKYASREVIKFQKMLLSDISKSEFALTKQMYCYKVRVEKVEIIDI